MSYVTNAVVMLRSWTDNEQEIISDINDFFYKTERPFPFKVLNPNSLDLGGSKYLEAIVLLGAFNHLDVSALINHLESICNRYGNDNLYMSWLLQTEEGRILSRS